MNWRFNETGWRILPGGLAAIGFAALLKLGALQPLEAVAYNALFRLRGETPWDDRMVLVKIDDDTLKKLGRFPLPRKYYAQLVDRLTQAGASVIAIDILLSESSPDDPQLAAAMARSQRVVLAQEAGRTGSPLLPVPILREAMLGSGHIRISSDSDGIVRRVEPQLQGDLAFGVTVVEAYSLLQEAVPQPDVNQAIVLNWAGSVRRMPQYSLASVLQGAIPAEAFHHKIVVVGVTATGFDAVNTPFDLNPSASGVHLQATLIHNLLQQNALHWIDDLSLVWLIGFGPVLSVLLSFWRTEIQAVFALTLTLSWGGISLGLFILGYLLPVAFPIGLIITTTLITALTEQLRINAILQRQVQQLWQTYQSDLVLHPGRTTEIKPQPSLAKITAMQPMTQLAALAEQFGRSQSTQAAIARSLSLGLVAADFDGLVWFCNPSAANLLHLELGSHLVPTLVPEWFTVEEWNHSLAVLQTGTPTPAKEKLFRQNWYCLQMEPITYQPEQQSSPFKLDGILLLIEDINDRKKLEISLDRQIDKLNQINQLKDDFISTVSHELRTPLTNMKMAIQLLQIIKTEEQREQYIRILESECNRETALINELLDLQRLDAGRHVLQPEVIKLQTWLPEIIDPFYKRTEAYQQYLSITVPDELPPVICDRSSLERILAELVNNACKYTPPDGEIRVMADDMDSQVELRVSNSGVEIPVQERSRIFERFYRVPNGDFAKQGGTGLGLALVKKLVESLDGEIEVKSSNGWTTFTVQLPLKS